MRLTKRQTMSSEGDSELRKKDPGQSEVDQLQILRAELEVLLTSALKPSQKSHANQANAVVVAIQYRLNLFGFLQPPADIESIPANRGLRDQIESLKWVQKNIASFGGDAESVTLWGQSAGARSVVALYNSPMSTGLFHQAIAMSPGYIPAMFQADISLVQETFGHRCMEATKCSSLKCLKEMKVETLAKSCIFYLQAEDFVTVPGVYFSGFDGTLERQRNAGLLEGHAQSS
ncbi:Carboxylesterase 1F (Carboxylic ester hydrolase) (Triacylglycerol hydrolase 2) (TGH-2) [Durusdinium trenchii]|uniref:Carboxylic ester hydrolase n=1 Tax=Durusdinium trenchii TaxID=1381693 RepID=A0ABP0JF41_9DINO